MRLYSKERSDHAPAEEEKAIMLESMEDAYDASADIEKALSYEDIIRLFAGLPETYRAVLEMKFLLDCSGKDISQKLGISENAVNVRISAAARCFGRLWKRRRCIYDRERA